MFNCPGVGETDNKSWDDVAKDESAGLQDLAPPSLPAWHADVALLPLNQVVVAQVGP